MIHGVYEFTQEYDADDYVDIASIPADARAFRIMLRAEANANGFMWMDGQYMTQCIMKVGTSNNPEAFSNLDQQGNPIDVSSMPWTQMMWHKESSQTSLRLTFAALTSGLSGKKLEYFIEYIQE
jgi:hypothetical protein